MRIVGTSIADPASECDTSIERWTTDNDDELEWRDTYFILFNQSDRPTLTQVEAAISGASRRLKLEHLEADDDGMFESVLVQAPEDNAALEISYETGEAVVAQSTDLAKQLKGELDKKQLTQMLKADARLGRDAVRAGALERLG